MRAKYRESHEAFTENQLVSRDDPFMQFKAWFDEAKCTKEIIEPTAVCLATASKNGVPSARMVLMKGYGPEGFQFFTHYSSRKGRELEENSKAALLFYWDILHKQIRIEGEVSKLPFDEAEKYFKSRPVPSQIGSAASNQSCVIPNRDHLLDKARELEK
uniref:pyridoxal 5'-phosphate synthase n=3 Tax=Rhodnius TaxID=13248 RepID=T1IGQ2_RHOPR